METIDFNTLGITLVTILGSAGAWQYYTKKAELKAKAKTEEKTEHTLYRDDLRERVVALETRLEQERDVNSKLQVEIGELKTKLTEYKVRLEYLEQEKLRLSVKAGEA